MHNALNWQFQWSPSKIEGIPSSRLTIYCQNSNIIHFTRTFSFACLFELVYMSFVGKMVEFSQCVSEKKLLQLLIFCCFLDLKTLIGLRGD